MEFDWSGFQPNMRATLCFVFEGERVLLIRKKRGLGAGKVNAPGGRIDPGETPAQTAVREVEEELGVTPLAVEERGQLSFQFVDGLALHCHVFVAFAHAGEAVETEEAVPLWTPLDRLPYDQMWEDDRVWLPELLAGRRFALRAVFDGEAMLSHELERLG